MEETDLETVFRKKMKPASRYKKRLAANFRGGFTPACITDTEIPPPYVFTLHHIQTKWFEFSIPEKWQLLKFQLVLNFESVACILLCYYI